MSTAAYADTYQTFNLISNGADGAYTTGTLTLDSSLNLFTAANLTVTGSDDYSAPLTKITESYSDGAVIEGPGLDFDLYLPISGLGNYQGGPICSQSLSCEGAYSSLGGTLQHDGTLSLAATTPSSMTPEPTSLILFGTGLLGLAGALKHRFA